MRQNGKLIGLTGGIASGKSTVAEHLRTNGILVIDADQVAHSCYVPGSPTLEKICSVFGEHILSPDGRINRKALGKIVFGNPGPMNRLQAIVWPETEKKIREAIEAAREADPVCPVVVEAAVLIEAGWQKIVEEVWLVTVSEGEAVRRLTRRNGLSKEDALKRIHSQMSVAQKRTFAHEIINNDGDPAALKQTVMLLLSHIWKSPD